MKIILLADLHGNMIATEALEREIDKIAPDDIWFLGDAVGKGPESDKTCDWVRSHCNHWIAGNWDRGISRHRNEHHFYSDQIGPERFDWLDSLPLEDELTISGIRFADIRLQLDGALEIPENTRKFCMIEETDGAFELKQVRDVTFTGLELEYEHPEAWKTDIAQTECSDVFRRD